MKTFFAALALCCMVVATANADHIRGSVNADGKIVISNSGADTEPLAGLDLISAGGNLVPDPAGNAAPFQFQLAGTANQITYGNLGTAVDVAAGAEIVTTAGYNTAAGADIAADLATSTWGMGVTPTALPFDGGGPVIPEPATGLMAIFAALGCLGFRRRR